MKKKLIITAIIAFAFFASCAKPPVEEMNNAIAAVARAENDPDVMAYAVNSLARAREALSNMQTEADAKRYEQAKKFALDAENLAERAIADAKNFIGRQKDEAASALSLMKEALVTTEDTLQNAHASGGKGLDLPRLDNDFASARQTAGQAEMANEESRYGEAIEHSQNARSALSLITSEISQAAISANRKK
ncbi:MAG: DUF4398 domain-containing protein [Spirochaetaceae bacterium]|jgi:hypothetical protein|nr:DUF4398 domain-containing protein [Spirochaetaceae bacterium]